MIDEAFISGIYEDMRPKLCGWLVAHNLDAAKAEDLVQEAFLRLWQRRESIRNCTPEVIGLLWRIVHNLMVDNFRRSRFETDAEDTAKISDENGNTTRHKSRADATFLAAQLSAALKAMPKDLAEAWQLFQLEQLSIREIANRSGASESLVKVRIHRARTRLKAVIEESEYGHGMGVGHNG